MKGDGCWICAAQDIVYVDVIDMAWCKDCYNNVYLADE